ncbi:hypothetical protein GJU39_22915 [Pedobacter petrophilus]|uniref:Uncharacterized protein n=1 Tax=Pedobacter petrophilus TaxID=1908241 RepID=A0A7K0G5J4_9SPHI|nr:hypothetical protein [Pedobacter petrophilus]MRX78921.1 hypothetical protein [Pedobacter petrophilus]
MFDKYKPILRTLDLNDQPEPTFSGGMLSSLRSDLDRKNTLIYLNLSLFGPANG